MSKKGDWNKYPKNPDSFIEKKISGCSWIGHSLDYNSHSHLFNCKLMKGAGGQC
jgi:hypothetical protein